MIAPDDVTSLLFEFPPPVRRQTLRLVHVEDQDDREHEQPADRMQKGRRVTHSSCSAGVPGSAARSAMLETLLVRNGVVDVGNGDEPNRPIEHLISGSTTWPRWCGLRRDAHLQSSFLD